MSKKTILLLSATTLASMIIAHYCFSRIFEPFLSNDHFFILASNERDPAIFRLLTIISFGAWGASLGIAYKICEKFLLGPYGTVKACLLACLSFLYLFLAYQLALSRFTSQLVGTPFTYTIELMSIPSYIIGYVAALATLISAFLIRLFLTHIRAKHD